MPARVFNRIRQSVVFRIGALMLATALVAVTSMLASYIISDAAENDAAAVNLSGSVRMLTYKLAASAVSGDADSAQSIANQLSDRLDRIDDISDFNRKDRREEAAQYSQVLHEWENDIRPYFLALASGERASDYEATKTVAANFVEDVDTLVLDFQHTAEATVDLLRLVQLGSLFATITLIYLSLFALSRSVEQPLKQLTDCCANIARGNFRYNLELTSGDELGVLADTIRGMSKVIEETQRDLAQRVESKTAELLSSHRVLDFHFRLARAISEGELSHSALERWLAEFSELTGLRDLDLCLMTAAGGTPFSHLTQGSGNTACRTVGCESCARGCDVKGPDGTNIYRFPLEADGRNYGVLVCTLPDNEALPREQVQRLSTFVGALTTASALRDRREQERRAALMDERSIIARELHDSLAQSLSYLKIQVARLNRCNNASDTGREDIREIIDELKQGLQNSYRQLRELLTTFRLQIDDSGLKATLLKVIEHYQEQHPEIGIELEYNLSEIPLTPQEEIHLLQLVREASQNAVYHSRGDHITIRLNQHSHGQILVQIEDNGVGIGESPEKRDHFGMSIMRERADNLAGELDIRPRPQGGTQVHFSFIPAYSREQQVQWR
ncbi:ATP-binding protein [Microbulbifer hainanensis]|uniref:ATP-binding protein n=1 Tax=Microbulbifer hainanensis TaxID=2735675 RepID=UPI001867FFA0|nr:ATP-binding protein [Microbulbifer hainanensis]